MLLSSLCSIGIELFLLSMAIVWSWTTLLCRHRLLSISSVCIPTVASGMIIYRSYMKHCCGLFRHGRECMLTAIRAFLFVRLACAFVAIRCLLLFTDCCGLGRCSAIHAMYGYAFDWSATKTNMLDFISLCDSAQATRGMPL